MKIITLLFIITTSLAHAVTLSNSNWRIDINPTTLATAARLPSGQILLISSAGKVKTIEQLKQNDSSASWQFDIETTITAQLTNNTLTLQFTRTIPGQIQWPVIPSGARALILPIHEGYYIPHE